jgi:regulator of protease activity HflC (stomatin/prohibitin superfamily)
MNAYPLSLDGQPPAVKKRPQPRWRRVLLNHLTGISLFLMLTLLIGIVLYPYVVVNVPTGHVGVLWKRFRGGTVLDPRMLKDEGFRMIWPWDRLFLYDLRLQSRTDTYTAISKDGVGLTAAINIRFRLKHDSVPQLHQSIGPNFVNSLVVPEIGNRMREVIADYSAEEVYSTKRQEIQDKIRARAEAMLGEKMMEHSESEDYAPYRIPLYAMLNLIDTLVLGIELPPAIVIAINRKLEQYYIAQEYTFRVEREIKESQRKKIEAEGIRDFQQIVTQGINDSYLRWRGIEATLQLAQSTNAKTVIVGGGKDGLPIILGNVDAPASTAERPPASNGSEPRATAAGPTVPWERLSPSGLSQPPERLASSPALEAIPVLPPGAEASPSVNTPEVPRTYFPFPLRMSEIEAFFSRLAGAMFPPQVGGGPPPRAQTDGQTPISGGAVGNAQPRMN